MCKHYGIDISSWQGDIDLAAIAPEFVILRAGCGRTVDTKAARNMDECERLGIPYGVYWYSYALSEDDARAEAWKCLEVIQDRKVTVGVWFDMEDADGYKAKHNALRADLTSAMCHAFCGVVEGEGWYTGIYTSLSWLTDGYVAGCERYDKWVAWWGRNDGTLCTDASRYGSLHQYAGDVWHKGLKLDLDVSYKPLDQYKNPGKKPPNLGPDGTAITSGEDDTSSAADAAPSPQEEGSEETFWPPRMLCVGMDGPDVMALQGLLYAHGYNPGTCSGVFDSRTRAMVMAFQAENGLDPDGIAGPKTWAAITKISK